MVHMWNDEQVAVFCDDDSDDPLDFVTRERVDDVTCHACLIAAIEFGKRCRERLDNLQDEDLETRTVTHGTTR